MFYVRRMLISLPFVYSALNNLLFISFKFAVFIFKGYLAVYILSCCHEILEDHREGTVNARSKSANMLISSFMLWLTFIGIYGVTTSRFGLFFAFLFLKPLVRIFELDSMFWTSFAAVVLTSGSTFCYYNLDEYSAPF